MPSSKYRAFAQIIAFVLLTFELRNVNALEHAEKNPEVSLKRFEGDIIPMWDEIRDDYSPKFAEKLVEEGILHKDDEKEEGNDLFVALGGAQTKHRWEERKDDVIQVPYTIPNYQSFTESEHDKIAHALNEISSQTGVVRFVKRYRHRDYITVIKDKGCYSYVGNIKRYGQRLSLGKGCLHHGVILHEFVHALGFYHEQSRRDRDNYVTIHTENIDHKYMYNFEKRNDVNSLGSAYDFDSIMHYGKSYFSTNGKATITTKNGEVLGQRKVLSKSDIEQIRLLYQCKSGPRTLKEYQDIPCSPDCPCWHGAIGCRQDSACQGQLICDMSKSQCVKKPEVCNDKNYYCSRWAKHDFCTTGNSVAYMKLACKKSCGLCPGSVTKSPTAPATLSPIAAPVCKEKFVKLSMKINACPPRMSVSKQDCLAAGLALGGKKRDGKMVVGNWHHTPPGCFLAGAVHYSHNPNGKNDGRFEPVCKKYIVKEGDYTKLPPGKFKSCPSLLHVRKEDCVAAGLALGGNKRGGKLVEGSWKHTPSGCFLAEDGAVHYSHNPNGNLDDRRYEPVCKDYDGECTI